MNIKKQLMNYIQNMEIQLIQIAQKKAMYEYLFNWH